MDDAVKTMAMTLVQGVIKKVLISGGALLTGHGIATGFTTADYVGASLAIAALSTSLWQDYGKAIVLSQLDVLRARSLAAAQKIKDAGLKPVTVAEIADQSPTLTPAQVIKVADTMAPEIKASVVPAIPLPQRQSPGVRP